MELATTLIHKRFASQHEKHGHGPHHSDNRSRGAGNGETPATDPRIAFNLLQGKVRQHESDYRYQQRGQPDAHCVKRGPGGGFTLLNEVPKRGADNKLMGLDLFYEDNSHCRPVVIYVHGFNGFKDWGNFDLIAAKFAADHDDASRTEVLPAVVASLVGRHILVIEAVRRIANNHCSASPLRDSILIGRINRGRRRGWIIGGCGYCAFPRYAIALPARAEHQRPTGSLRLTKLFAALFAGKPNHEQLPRSRDRFGRLRPACAEFHRQRQDEFFITLKLCRRQTHPLLKKRGHRPEKAGTLRDAQLVAAQA